VPADPEVAAPACELLDWDSEFFGFPIARVRGSVLTDASAASIDAWCEEREIHCLYLLADADDPETARVAGSSGYRQVDVRLTLRHELEPLPHRGSDALVRDADGDDIPWLRELAARSHDHSRFFHDPGFDRRRCGELYATWMEAGTRDPDRWVLVAELEGSPVGYQLITPGEDGGTTQMNLLAVDEAHRGRRLGRTLLAEGLRRAHSHGSTAVETATQERNEASLQAHLALGFTGTRRQVWHHKWFR
jgi:dTDP-4-amino-4,6-dideoxy-D-galactose acyltransferase